MNSGGLVPGSSWWGGVCGIVVLPMGLQSPSAPAPSVLSLTPPFVTPHSVQAGFEHPPLHLPGSGRASQETTTSGSHQHALLGIRNSVWGWCLYMGWISRRGSLWMAFPSVLSRNILMVDTRDNDRCPGGCVHEPLELQACRVQGCGSLTIVRK